MFKTRKPFVVGVVPLVVAAITLAEITPAFAAGPSNAVSQFSTKSNPRKSWSYFADGTLLNHAVPKGFCGPRMLGGWDNGGGIPNEASVAANKTAAALACTANSTVTVPAESLNLDPESAPNVSVVWTAKKAGTYTVVGEFTGDDSFQRSHSVAILHNATSVYTNTISSNGQVDSFNLMVTVAKHDTVSFTVDTGSGANDLSTGLQATLTKS